MNEVEKSGECALSDRPLLHVPLFMFKKNYRSKHTCNHDNDIGRRKQQKLAYYIFTCKFTVPCITTSALGRSWHCNDEIRQRVHNVYYYVRLLLRMKQPINSKHQIENNKKMSIKLGKLSSNAW